MDTYLMQNRYCLQDDKVEEIEPEAHLQGTIQEQMLYNRRTLKEITEITYESEKQVFIVSIIFFSHKFYVLI